MWVADRVTAKGKPTESNLHNLYILLVVTRCWGAIALRKTNLYTVATGTWNDLRVRDGNTITVQRRTRILGDRQI